MENRHKCFNSKLQGKINFHVQNSRNNYSLNFFFCICVSGSFVNLCFLNTSKSTWKWGCPCKAPPGCEGLMSLPQEHGEGPGSRWFSCPGFPSVQPVENEGSVLVKCLTRFIFFTALELDKNRVIETAPLSFRTLLGVLGIEATLESLIKSFCTEESS